MQRDAMSKGIQNKFESQPTQTVLIVIVVVFRIFDSHFKPDNLGYFKMKYNFSWLHVQYTVSRYNVSIDNIQVYRSPKKSPFVPKKSPCCQDKSDKSILLL